MTKKVSGAFSAFALVAVIAACAALFYTAPAPPAPVLAPVKVVKADPVAPFDIRPVVSLIGRFSMAHGCPVGARLLLTNAHVTDPVPFGDAPLIPYRGWNAIEGNIRVVPVGVSYAADISLMKPVDGQPDLHAWFALAAAEPAVGEQLYWIGYDWRHNADMFKQRVFSGPVLRVIAGNIVINAQTSQGSSGSCVLNQRGEVVGIVAWGMGSQDPKEHNQVTVSVGTFGTWGQDVRSAETAK